MPRTITVVGGGLAGLIAAIECAEAGEAVRLLEARSRLGGRAATIPGPYAANLGPHALYTGGSLWDWLRARDLHKPSRPPRSPAIRFRWGHELRRTPPPELLGCLRLVRRDAPVDVSFRAWMTDHAGPEAADALSGAAGPLTFDHDPGRLSAAFVWEKLTRILLRVPTPARYVVGGWAALVARLADQAAQLGVSIEAGVKVESLADVGSGPVIVALDPGGARRLLDDAALVSESPRVALVDVGLVARRGDPYLVLDLDEAAFVDRFTAVDRTLAPAGHSLVQASVGMRPGEELNAAEARVEAILDLAFDEWRDRVVWRRRGAVRESTGALDLPGATWRDRPAIAHPSGALLAGDWVAAPGHLAEVSCASAVVAARAAVGAEPVARQPSVPNLRQSAAASTARAQA
jgi:phytoene dehydrogenase-like protein